jgi:hypothetical protein
MDERDDEPMPGMMTAGAPPMPMMGGGAKPPGLPAGPPGPTGPATVAPDSAGLKMRGKIMVSLGLKQLTKALGLIGVESEEGQELAKALASLGKRFGDASPDVSQQEAKMMSAGASPVGQPTPQQGAAFQNMIRSKLGGMQGAGLGGPPAAAPTP